MPRSTGVRCRWRLAFDGRDGLITPTRRSELLAAQCALGDGSYLSGRTSLACAGVRAHNTREIHVTVLAESTPRHPGLRTHRTSVVPTADKLRTRDGLRCSAPALALVEVAATETAAELDRLIAELARRRLLELDRVDDAMRRRRGRPGISRLRAALARYLPLDAEQLSSFEWAFEDWRREETDIHVLLAAGARAVARAPAAGAGTSGPPGGSPTLAPR